MYSILELFYFSIFRILESIKYPHFWAAIFVVFLQYKKIGKIEKEVLGINKRSPLLNTFQAVLFGLLGGILGSIIFIYLRVIIDERDFLFILPLALILSTIDPRFVCFSYSGGIISLLSLLVGWPDINVTGIMFVVGILHLVESMLVLLDGTRTKIPLLMKKENKALGGFSINSFWPVPFIIYANRGIPYPVLLFAVLGYGDFTLYTFPKKKTKENASLLFTFSIFLIIFSRLSVDYNLFQYIAAIFAPLAHEIIIYLGKHKEREKVDIFTNYAGGLRILDVLPNSVGEKIGFNSGDIILTVNGKKISSKKDLESITYYRPKIISAKMFNMRKGIVVKEFISKDKGIDTLGIITIPNEAEDISIIEESKSILLKLLSKLDKKSLSFKN